jgi:hypothetical protein
MNQRPRQLPPRIRNNCSTDCFLCPFFGALIACLYRPQALDLRMASLPFSVQIHKLDCEPDR